MKHICFLSCQDVSHAGLDDNLTIAELEKNGEYKISTIPWDNHADWAAFDLVIIRTTWDYYKRPQEFLDKLDFIASQTRVINSVEVVKWNYHKEYLKELESKGTKIVPTQMFHYPGKIEIPLDWDYPRLIVKPAVSASAYKTMIVTKEELVHKSFLAMLHPGDWMLQPFLEEIKQGEVSLYFFDKKYSHGITKIPKPGDFRVQEEHGGTLLTFEPDQELLALADRLLKSVPFDLTYARIDLVYWQGNYVLMELELIEPALYLSTNSQAVMNFKGSLDKIFTTP